MDEITVQVILIIDVFMTLILGGVAIKLRRKWIKLNEQQVELSKEMAKNAEISNTRIISFKCCIEVEFPKSIFDDITVSSVIITTLKGPQPQVFTNGMTSSNSVEEIEVCRKKEDNSLFWVECGALNKETSFCDYTHTECIIHTYESKDPIKNRIKKDNEKYSAKFQHSKAKGTILIL